MLGRRKFLFQLGSCTAVASSGCGTLLQSERIGRPHSNEIDWKIAALDGLGLMLFFVPGAVAFAVDFYNGSIYLPLQSSPTTAQHKSDGEPLQTAKNATTGLAGNVDGAHPDDPAPQLQRVTFPSKRLTPEQLEAVVSEQMGQPIPLLPDHTRVSKLASLDHFSQQCQTHRRDSRFGMSLKTFFAGKNRRRHSPHLS